ncbi:YusW family protein [Sporosarcina sp. Marseille-Q4063]|uniref:YusW family protein n=1 Tax=Sporosarcina sp. Marseille-Q4063 TaxID=2810514 RepID=UPI001BAF91DE|nr:YusW family protein [Sporosarcina sp. Marseille-Q4063]QUW22849.1 YusW family protein [Sporosarcina sp. Marseille-Q4063]
MKKITLFIALLALSLVIVACGTTKKDDNQTQDKQTVEDTNDDVTNGTDGNAGTDGTDGTDDTDENTGTNTNETNAGDEDELAKMDELDYEEFSLEIEYGNQDEYEAELEKNMNNTVEAKIEDSINGVEKNGTEAFNELYPLVESLTINQETGKEEAIKEILEVFNMNNDYSKFEVEIKFKDGTKIEFEDKK